LSDDNLPEQVRYDREWRQAAASRSAPAAVQATHSTQRAAAAASSVTRRIHSTVDPQRSAASQLQCSASVYDAGTDVSQWRTAAKCIPLLYIMNY